MRKITLLCATTALALPSMAFAQSTGTIEVEEEIVVTGARSPTGVNGIVVSDAARAQGVLTQEQIARQAAGQTILNAINIIPGVNFTNNDPYGSSGGGIRIRGFEGNRISLTFDGLPLNDTGNYAIFSNQQLDPELIERVSVNLGQTDVDSPTASAAGGTINYRTRLPSRTVGARSAASYGDFGFNRIFGMVDTGEIFSFGTRAFASASTARNDLFRGPGRIYKQQYNARVYQPLSGNDFLSVSGHYNQNRNNFFRNPNINDVRTLLGNPTTIPVAANISPSNPAIVGGNLSDAQWDAIFGFSNLPTCQRAAPAGGSRQDENAGAFGTCTNFFGLRINPSNTGNIRANSRFQLAEGLVLTIDPSYQYVLANGGGTQVLEENAPQLGGNNATSPSARVGIDLNGDGDVLDRVRLYTPNTTNTHRYGLTSSLIWDVAANHRLRLAYTFDYGRHRQTGEFGPIGSNGVPENVFSGRNGAAVVGRTGAVAQGRDRKSIASLNQIAGQYVGRFFDRRLRLELGLRAPFFKRELNQNCFTNQGGSSAFVGGISVGGGFTLCAPISLAQAQALSPGFIAPFEQNYKFDALLPNVGAVYNLGEGFSLFGSFARGFSAPRTDNLYRRTFVDIQPETTDAFDLGARFTSGNVQAQATGWLINYQNRIITSFDPDLGIAIDRNVGAVRSRGFDASIAFQPIEQVTLYTFGSYIKAEFQEDVQLGFTRAPGAGQTVPINTPILAPTRGKMVAETPKWQFGGRVQFEVGPAQLGVTGKWVDDRFATDVNDVIVPSYTVVDLDARFSLAGVGLETTFFQFNVINLFNERYFGNIGTQINAGNVCPVGANCAANSNNPNFTPGAPRTVLGTLTIGF